jgi:Mrp family chromosome partitioning ATPase
MMATDLRLPVLADAPGAGVGSENGHVMLRRSGLESSQATLEGLRRLAGELHCALLTSVGGGAAPVAIGVATAAALEGRRVMLIECELSRPELAGRLGLRPAPGLREYLAWEATAPELLQPINLSGAAVDAAHTHGQLVCVVGGGETNEAVALVASDSFSGAMRKLRKAYELVVLAAPRLSAGELPLIARYADALAICAGEAELTKGSVGHAIARLPIQPGGIVRLPTEPDQRS